jgi:flagellar hook-length control protein FliK
MMQLAKPASSLPQAAVIAPSIAAGAANPNAAATPFSAVLESHHVAHEHSQSPQTQGSASTDSVANGSKPSSEKTPDPARTTTPDRSVDKQTERNRLNAQREAKQAMNRTAPPATPTPAAPRPTNVAAQKVDPEDKPVADDPKEAHTADDAAFNPLALLQWISEQSAQTALAGKPTAGITEAPERSSAEETTEDTAELPGTLPTFSGLRTAVDGASGQASAGGAVAWMDKTPGNRTGLGIRLPLAGSPLAAASRATPLDEEQTTTASRTDALGVGTPVATGALGLEGWNRAVAGVAMDMSSALPTATPKVAAAANVVETNSAPQPLALGVSNNSLVDTTTVSVNLPTPVQSPEFRELLGSQISLLAKDGVQSAELHLNPAEMGPVSVQITLDGTQARVDFGADSAQTRQYIESSLPELASAMRDAGLTLSGGGVSQHAHGRESPPDSSRSSSTQRKASGEDAVDAVSRAPVSTRRVALGGVDLYA